MKTREVSKLLLHVVLIFTFIGNTLLPALAQPSGSFTGEIAAVGESRLPDVSGPGKDVLSGIAISQPHHTGITATDVPAGDQILDIDVASANPAPDGSPYAGFREKIELIEGVTNVVERPFFFGF